MPRMTRRAVLGGAAGLVPLAAVRTGRAQTRIVKVALLTPLSGQWARQGELEKMGAVLAVEDVNKNGGIRSLGGAQLALVMSSPRAKLWGAVPVKSC
jgi:branched-chain amino acid transport system substrate-binding protein